MTQGVTDSLKAITMPTRPGMLYDFAWNEFCSFYVEMLSAAC